MMAKMFYTMDETKVALGKGEDDVKQLVRDGRLREFRDGSRLMFKADQVEALKSEVGGGGDQVDLGPSDTGAPIGLADSRGASSSGIALADSGAGSGMMNIKEDTALAADLGLSGSIGGVPSPGHVSPGGSQAGGSGISVFGADEVDRADPMAQTNISGSISDQVNLEGVGSGSGLLDLTRESDDTSLGAELLDEIAPSPGRIHPQGAETQMGGSGSMPGLSNIGGSQVVSSTQPRTIGAPVYVEAADPMAPAFGAMALGAAFFALFTGFFLLSGTMGYKPAMLAQFASYGLWVIFGIGLAVAIVFFIVGMIIGRATTR